MTPTRSSVTPSKPVRTGRPTRYATMKSMGHPPSGRVPRSVPSCLARRRHVAAPSTTPRTLRVDERSVGLASAVTCTIFGQTGGWIVFIFLHSRRPPGVSPAGRYCFPSFYLPAESGFGRRFDTAVVDEGVQRGETWPRRERPIKEARTRSGYPHGDESRTRGDARRHRTDAREPAAQPVGPRHTFDSERSVQPARPRSSAAGAGRAHVPSLHDLRLRDARLDDGGSRTSPAVHG
jgi:hypothetical protein